MLSRRPPPDHACGKVIHVSVCLVLDHDFTAAGEFVRVFLQSGQVYRAELSSPDVTLQLRAVIEGVGRPTQLPRIYPFLRGDVPSGTSIVEIYPEVDAEYEIRAVETGGAGVATRLRLYRDVRASARRQYVRTTRGWEIGVELGGGWHSGFAQSSAPLPPGSEPDGGTDLEGCFSLGHSRPGQSNWELGLCSASGSELSRPPRLRPPRWRLAFTSPGTFARTRRALGGPSSSPTPDLRIEDSASRWGRSAPYTPPATGSPLGSAGINNRDLLDVARATRRYSRSMPIAMCSCPSLPR